MSPDVESRVHMFFLADRRVISISLWIAMVDWFWMPMREGRLTGWFDYPTLETVARFSYVVDETSILRDAHHKRLVQQSPLVWIGSRGGRLGLLLILSHKREPELEPRPSIDMRPVHVQMKPIQPLESPFRPIYVYGSAINCEASYRVFKIHDWHLEEAKECLRGACYGHELE